MKLPKTVDIRHSIKLFNKKYQYKVVLRLGLAGCFRGGDPIQIDKNIKCRSKPPKDDYLYAQSLRSILTKMEDFQVRVETPFVSIYLNDKSRIEQICKIDYQNVKYVSIPDPNTKSQLNNTDILVKKLDFDYKVTIGSASQNYISFVNWCKDNPKIRLPKRAARDLSHNWSSGGGYFYVKEEKVLTMVKMFLGRTITRIENVVRG